RLAGDTDGFAGARYIGRDGAGETCNRRPLAAPGDLLHRLEIALARDREACLDDIDAHLVKDIGDLKLLLRRHGGAWRLLAVAQRRVKDDDAILFRTRGGLN